VAAAAEWAAALVTTRRHAEWSRLAATRSLATPLYIIPVLTASSCGLPPCCVGSLRAALVAAAPATVTTAAAAAATAAALPPPPRLETHPFAVLVPSWKVWEHVLIWIVWCAYRSQFCRSGCLHQRCWVPRT